MITKIDFNEFVKNNSENLSHELYKIIIDEIELQNKDKERDIWMNRLETLAAMLSTIVHFNKNVLNLNLSYGDLANMINLVYIYDFYQKYKDSDLISQPDKEKIYGFLAALPGWDFNKTIDEQPVDAFEIFGYESMHLTKILHTIFK